MESTNFSLKSLDWSTLLKETSEDSCDSDETLCDPIDNDVLLENRLQHHDQNTNKHKGENDHQPMVQEILDTITSNQNPSPRPNEDCCSNHSDQSMQYELETEYKVNNEPCNIIDGYGSHFKFSAANNYIKEGDEKKHRFESDFGFTDMSSLRDISTSVNNLTLQPTDVCTSCTASSTACNSNSPVEFGLNNYLILKNNQDQIKTSDSGLKPREVYNEKSVELVTGANYLPFEEEPTKDLLSAVSEDVEEDEFLEGLTPNLDCLMRESFFDNLNRCGEILKTKPCSPPLTLSKGIRRKVLPADKVLPNYKKKNWTAETKQLPMRKCSSAYIDISNRKCEDDTQNKESSTTDSEAEVVTVQPQTERASCRKQLFEGEVINTKTHQKVNQSFSYKVKRRRKKKGVYGRVKQETETTSESACQETDIKNGVEKTTQEIKACVEELEERVARWVSGSDDNPPTRQLAFQMLADAQTYIATLHLRKKKNGSRRKCIQKDELKIVKFLLERSQQLEIAIDKAIAEADRLMNMELNEMSEDSRTVGKEIFDRGMIEKNKYLKPILKNSSSEVSTEEAVNNKQHISFSEEVEYRYLSCSEQSTSSFFSQSVYEHTDSSDNKENNSVSTLDMQVANIIDFEKSLDTNLNSNLHQKSKTNDIHNSLEPDVVSFQNLIIDPLNTSNQPKSKVRTNFRCLQTDQDNSLACDENGLVQPKTVFEGSILQSKTSFHFPTQDQLSVNSISEGNLSNGNDCQQLSHSIQYYRDSSFGFSDQETETEVNFSETEMDMPTIMDIKYIRVPNPSEFRPWHPSDPPDNWSDLED